MLREAFVHISSELAQVDYICSVCGENLGCYNRIGVKVRDDIEGWNYCPYCGEELK